MSSEQVLGLRQTLEQTLQQQKEAAKQLRVEQASKYFLIRFLLLSGFLYGFSAVAFTLWAPQMATASYYGMAICTITSFVSFLLSEWAFDQPKGVFMMVSLGSIVVRMFNLLLAYALGLFGLKFHPMYLATGLLVTYFSYMIVEIAYIHNKALLRGE